MKIINGKDIGKYPNGTIFLHIIDPSFRKYGGDMQLGGGVNIICGKLKDGSPRFNGVMHLLKWCPCSIDGTSDVDINEDFDICYDTTEADYGEQDWLVILSNEEIRKLIRDLKWAIDGCKDDIDDYYWDAE